MPQISGKNHPMYGKKHTEETKKKIKEARARQEITPVMLKSLSKGRVKVWTPEMRNRLSEVAKKRGLGKMTAGNKHWNWKGGITDENALQRGSEEYRIWRMNVFRRDRFTCQDCGCVGKNLVAHHVKEWSDYPELRFDVDNGLTLCRSCHAKVHDFIQNLPGKVDV